MQPEEQVDFDGFPESLERRLRNLPKLAVPNYLEARLLAAIPTDNLVAIPNRMRTFRLSRTLMSAGLAAACLAMVLLRPKFEDLVSKVRVAVRPGQREIDHRRLIERPDEYLPIVSGFQDPRLIMNVETQPFTWPINQKSPLMVSSKIPSDLLD